MWLLLPGSALAVTAQVKPIKPCSWWCSSKQPSPDLNHGLKGSAGEQLQGSPLYPCADVSRKASSSPWFEQAAHGDVPGAHPSVPAKSLQPQGQDHTEQVAFVTLHLYKGHLSGGDSRALSSHLWDCISSSLGSADVADTELHGPPAAEQVRASPAPADRTSDSSDSSGTGLLTQ